MRDMSGRTCRGESWLALYENGAYHRDRRIVRVRAQVAVAATNITNHIALARDTAGGRRDGGAAPKTN